jgi:predicted nucleic acid-binding protein
MKFWDSSALLPLLVQETYTPAVRQLVQEDNDILAWWGTPVVCVSALARLERDQALSSTDVENCLQRLHVIQNSWFEIQPNQLVRETAFRLLRTHTLRAADALQLAAAICAAENRPSTLEFVCLDNRLITAARKEGFSVFPKG